MDHEWAASQLRDFRSLIDVLGSLISASDDPDSTQRWDDLVEQHGSANEVSDRIVMMEPIMRDLMEAARPEFGNYPDSDSVGYPLDSEDYWRSFVRPNVLRAIGVHDLIVEAREKLRPDSPDLVADQFHSWVWDAAMPLWSAGSRQEAVQAAARSVNARLQQKLNRRDISDTTLCREAFSPNDPTESKPRLRFAGDRASETWRSRQQGAMEFGSGCFQGIRNPVSHEHDLDMPHMVALEQLAAFSVLARWIDECEVERHPSQAASGPGPSS